MSDDRSTLRLVDSLRTLLKNRAQIFTDTWHDDSVFVMADVFGVVSKLLGSGGPVMDVYLVIRIVPVRIWTGFAYFQEDFLVEIERLKDAKDKRIFMIRVLTALTSLILGSIYDVRRGKLNFRAPIWGNRYRSLNRILIGEVLFKLGRRLLVLFFEKLKEGAIEPRDRIQVQYFIHLLLGEKSDQLVMDLGPKLEIVEKLKKYLMTGER